MWEQILPGLRIKLFMTIVLGVIYPLVMTGISQVVFPRQANGSLIKAGGKVIGSELIGQNFTSPKYFHGRPSVTTGTDASGNSVAQPYNAANSYASNLGPTSKALVDRVTADTAKLQAENPGKPVPVDLVTTSASGLDPDITPASAYFQVLRVAKARNLPEDQLRQLVTDHIEGRFLGILGEPHVNVLKLNLALDALGSK